MNVDELKTWLSYHGTRFPSFVDWSAKNRESIATWGQMLQFVSLSHAQAVSAEMQSGRIKTPFHWETLPGIIVGRSNSLSCEDSKANMYSGRFDGCRTVRCKTCDDSGRVEVWQAYSEKKILSALNSEDTRPQDLPLRDRRSYSLACSCSAGEKFGEPVAKYDPEIVTKLDYSKSDDGWADYCERVADDMLRPVAQAEFENWNQGGEQ